MNANVGWQHCFVYVVACFINTSMVFLPLFLLAGSQIDPLEVGSTKGSVVYGPDGSVIKVGETIKLSARDSVQSVHDVQDAHLAPGLIGIVVCIIVYVINN